MNAASSYVDASGLYGNTEEAISKIRSNVQGLVNLKNCKNCKVEGATGALHTTLLREHNRIAKELLRFNPSWNDDELFYESRRVVSAIIQHITYNEFLPLVLGNEIMATEGLRLTSGKHFTNYSSTNRGGVFNEFATSAIPAFLTMYPPEMVSLKTFTKKVYLIND